MADGVPSAFASPSGTGRGARTDRSAAASLGAARSCHRGGPRDSHSPGRGRANPPGHRPDRRGVCSAPGVALRQGTVRKQANTEAAESSPQPLSAIAIHSAGFRARLGSQPSRRVPSRSRSPRGAQFGNEVAQGPGETHGHEAQPGPSEPHASRADSWRPGCCFAHSFVGSGSHWAGGRLLPERNDPRQASLRIDARSGS